ncbi:cytochrome c oxidase biogenesis protein cmc1-like protein [Nannochloropsis gaditana CCMP526]|uniref:cytochrome c oxidase biogenesis protein cmc1-like protein n=1 Tax=Nannochloropsis gaditana (strain CCMP526) TaxID=1093141 RepID=UPI00029F5942|nr:cytochrome c oxidase biogenesis protein cmc1-like protein [Nannochloropsis gaditana CCMP526]EKU22954.1 cytochrome c oxidase biogenesis protein cmc1-like protein [Nannochloropsis gaditana CCMP526]|eukprot:XP_005853405.1 cytochrome c oxidase biogenesis protein cmc1-like protein [Nannochloropsis gaditana CCMP526]
MVIDALLLCHQEHPWAKFWGECNEQKWALDKCFRMEKEQRRRANFAVASRDDGAWSQIVKQKEAELRAKKEEP